MYYLRTRPAANAIQFTVDQKVVQKVRDAATSKQDSKYQEQAMVCSIENKEACIMCSA